MSKKEESLQLLTAQKALEITRSQYTEETQLQNVIKAINKQLEDKSGKTYAFIGDGEKLYKGTIAALLEKGYDLSMYHSGDACSWDNIAYWDEKASGKVREYTDLAEDNE